MVDLQAFGINTFLVTLLFLFVLSGTFTRRDGCTLSNPLSVDIKQKQKETHLLIRKNCLVRSNECTTQREIYAAIKRPCTETPQLMYDGCWQADSYTGFVTYYPHRCIMMQPHNDSIRTCLDNRFRLAQNKTAWIYFLGDSSTRGLYCSFANITRTSSTDLNLIGCDPPVTMGGAQKEFFFTLNTTSGSAIKVSYTYSYEIADSSTTHFLIEMLKRPPHPDVIVYNSGAWEHEKKWDLAGSNVDMMRASGAQTVATFLQGFNYTGQFIYRNSICNTRFDGKLYDHLVQEVFSHAGYNVVDAFSLSIGRNNDSTWDGFHMDKTLGTFRKAWVNMPNVGQLNDVILAAVSTEICSGRWVRK